MSTLQYLWLCSPKVNPEKVTKNATVSKYKTIINSTTYILFYFLKREKKMVLNK